jgi:hypothetical protein
MSAAQASGPAAVNLTQLPDPDTVDACEYSVIHQLLLAQTAHISDPNEQRQRAGVTLARLIGFAEGLRCGWSASQAPSSTPALPPSAQTIARSLLDTLEIIEPRVGGEDRDRLASAVEDALLLLERIDPQAAERLENEQPHTPHNAHPTATSPPGAPNVK